MPTKRNSSRIPRSSKKARNSWSSSVIGTHASPRHQAQKPKRRSRATHTAQQASRVVPNQQYTKRSSASNLHKRTGEINQMHVATRSVDQRTNQHASNKSRAEEFMKQRRRRSIVIALVVIVIIVAVVCFIASCSFKTFSSASMALNNEEVSNELVAQSENEPYCILIAGISNYNTQSQAASYLAALRVDAQNNTFSLISIPNNIQTTVEQNKQDMLRNTLRYGGEAQLVRAVKNETGLEFAHYLRVTEDGLVELVDSLGGVSLNVEYRVDDPRVGHVVVPAGEQTLNGEQALAFASATNYQDGRTQRAKNQQTLLLAILDKMTTSEGLHWITDSDVVSNTVKTDMSYDSLSNLANIYSNGSTFYTATMPGYNYTLNNVSYFSPNANAWEEMKQQFLSGQDTNKEIDTSGVEKDKLSIVVQNGSGTDGFAAQAAQILEQNGYTIQDTGNADSFVYTETLVIYKDEEDEAAANAIVSDLGVGRAVYASVYYSLSTDIQVVVGQDWKPLG